MQAEMIATAYSKAQINWLWALISEIGIGQGITMGIPHAGLNCFMTLKSGNFQSYSRHVWLQYHSIHEAIAKGEIEIKHVAGTEMMPAVLTKPLGAVKLSKLVEKIWLR